MQTNQADAVTEVNMAGWPNDHVPSPKAEIKNLPMPVVAKQTQITLPPNPPPQLGKERVEVPMTKKPMGSPQPFHTRVGRYKIARLAQYVNSRLHYGWTGSPAEKKHCEAWNIKPVPVQQ